MNDEQFDIDSRKCRTCSEEFKFGSPWVCQKCLVSNVFEVRVEIERKNKKAIIITNIIFMVLFVMLSISLGVYVSPEAEVAFFAGWILFSIYNFVNERLK